MPCDSSIASWPCPRHRSPSSPCAGATGASRSSTRRCCRRAETWIELRGAQDSAAAIARLAIRGAPNIGIAAAYGLAMEVALAPDDDGVADAARAAQGLAADGRQPRVGGRPRPGGRARRRSARARGGRARRGRGDPRRRGRRERDDRGPRRRPARRDARGSSRTATPGTLACGGTGSALAVVTELAARGPLAVLACETRPLLQGARLTIWELRRAGVPHELLVDGAAAGLIRRGEVDAVIVGCDRVAANGDVANKVGTYAHALAANAAGIPFVVAGPDLDDRRGDRERRRDRDRGARRRRGALRGRRAADGRRTRRAATRRST